MSAQRLLGRAILSLVLAGLFGGRASATSIVVPGANAAIEGSSNNCFPFACGPQRYQQVYDAVDFGGLSVVVDTISFRIDDAVPSFGPTAFDLKIVLSNTSTSSATLSMTFADNLGASPVVVFDGLMLLSGTGGGSPNPFDIVLDVSNVFTYNGVDNLLLDVLVRSGSAGRQCDSVGQGGGMQRVWTDSGGDPNAATGNIPG